MGDFEWINNVGNKVFSATFEATNGCYVITLIVMADSEDEAKKKIHDWRHRNTKNDWGPTKYTSKLKEIEFNDHGISEVGFGRNDN